jgi:site-specific DNA recombinase
LREKAVIYTRVSTIKQKEEGTSLKTQEQEARKYALKKNFDVIECFPESKSASKDTYSEDDLFMCLSRRPELQKIIKLASQNKFKHLIVHSRDRLARNASVAMTLYVYLKKLGIEVHYIKSGENVNTSSEKMNEFLEMVFSSIAELEAGLLSNRAKSGLKKCVEIGRWPGGPPPYGYLIKKDRGEKSGVLVKSYLESEEVKKIFDLYVNYGYSYRKIVSEMNDSYPYKKWKKPTIESILRNETYTGQIVWNKNSKTSEEKDVIKSEYNRDMAIIDSSQWQSTQSLRNIKLNSLDKRIYTTPFLLKNKLICGKCNNIMTPKNYGKYKNGKPRESIYRCPTQIDKKSELIVKQGAIETLFIDEFINKIVLQDIDNIWAKYVQKSSELITNIEKHIQYIDIKVSEYNHKILQYDILLEDVNNQEESDIVQLTDLFITEKIRLKNDIEYMTESKKILLNGKSKIYKSKEELGDALRPFFREDFNLLEQGRKIVLLNILIDKIIVNEDNGNLNLDIIPNCNLDITPFTLHM